VRRCLLAAALLLTGSATQQSEPIVRIGLNQNAPSITVRSAAEFSVEQHRTRSATFTTALAIDPAASGSVKKIDLQYRILVDLDGDTTLVLQPGAHVRIEPASAHLEIGDRAYRGALEVFGNVRHTLTIVNELPLEE